VAVIVEQTVELAVLRGDEVGVSGPIPAGVDEERAV
jgi:hypothetical protein